MDRGHVHRIKCSVTATDAPDRSHRKPGRRDSLPDAAHAEYAGDEMTDSVETHPYNTSEPIPKGTCLLIIGTAPPCRFAKPPPKPFFDNDVDFFYGSAKNQLWSCILRKLYGKVFLLPSRDESRNTCREFLISQQFWMIDVLQTYRRKQPGSAKDSDLDPVIYTDFKPIFEQHPTIKTLTFTGGKAEEWTGVKLEKERLIRHGDFRKSGNMPRPRLLTIDLDGVQREIEAFTLPSPSRASDRRYRNSKLQMYEEVLLKRSPAS
jgi:G:T/U-mismatch repair DNA glycosylase